jgi:hypothetical protein
LATLRRRPGKTWATPAVLAGAFHLLTFHLLTKQPQLRAARRAPTPGTHVYGEQRQFVTKIPTIGFA